MRMLKKPTPSRCKRLESDIVAEAHEYAILRGWFTFKVESPTMTGLPDRFYARRGIIIFIEWKTKDGVLSERQKIVHRDMREHGITVYVFDNLEDAKKVLK